MPYVGDDVHQARKRRWEDDKNEVYRLYAQEKQQQPAFYVLNQAAQEGMQAARKMLPLAKRPRTIEDDLHIHGDLPPAHRRRTSQSRALQDQPLSSIVGNKGPPVRTGGVLLTPCHICHRKPTKKSDLDSFAECQGCRERTCFVCIRECQRWNADEVSLVLPEQEVLSRSFHMDDADDGRQDPHSNINININNNDDDDDDLRSTRNDNNKINEIGGNKSDKGWDASGHRAMVCSRCCVERGAEGEVVCLGCLSGMELA